MDLMDYRRKVIASSPHLSHAEGAVTSFSDGTDLPLKSLLVNIEPVQSGSGDPSPTNVRPISGWDAVGVHNGNTVVTTISLGRTVYGGTLNVLTGVLTVNMQIITGNANWGNYWNSHKAEQVDTYKRASFMLSLTNETVYAQKASAKCNMLTHDIVVLQGRGNKSAFCLHPTLGRYLYACLPLDTLGMSSATSATSDTDFKNAIKALGDNLQIVIPLATPQTYTLDPQTVRSLVGQNNIFSDTGNTSLEYWAHP